MPKPNLSNLIKNASSDLQPAPEITRGRGLGGMISDPEAQAAPSVDKSTSTHVHKSTADEASRPVKSFRLRPELVHQIEILAATQRRKLYEVVEEALEQYLKQQS
jgi:hypothetical protein